MLDAELEHEGDPVIRDKAMEEVATWGDELLTDAANLIAASVEDWRRT